MGSKYFPPQVFANIAELQGWDGDKIRPDTVVRLRDSISQLGYLGPSTYRFVAGATAVDATAQLVVNPAINAASGQWQCIDPLVNLTIPQTTFNFNLADAATLFTVPTGFRLLFLRMMQEIATPWTGGAASAIGVSSNNANFNTKGDLMGGAAGDVAANLAAGFCGTIGAKLAAQYVSTAGNLPVVLVAGNTLRFDRIVSAFTGGAGILNFQVARIG